MHCHATAHHVTTHRSGAFLQLKGALESHFPGLEVVGSNYPMSPQAVMAARAVGAVQIGARVCA